MAPVQSAFIEASRGADLFSRAREEGRRGRDFASLETAAAAVEHPFREELPLSPGGFATLLGAVRRVRRAFPLAGGAAGASGLDVSGDGTRICVLGEDGGLLWDVAGRTPRALARLETGLPLHPPRFSADGGRLLAATEKGAALWDAGDGRRVGRLRGWSPDAEVPAFSPDGRWIVAAVEKGARIWNARTGKAAGRLTAGAEEWCHGAQIGADGQRALTVSDRFIRVWRLETGEEIFRIASGTRYAFFTARFSPDGSRIVAAKRTRRVLVWNASDGSPAATLDGDRHDEVEDAWFSPDGGHVVARGTAGSLALWRLEDAGCLWRTGHEAHRFAFSPDLETVLTASGDRSGKIRLRDLRSGHLLETLLHAGRPGCHGRGRGVVPAVALRGFHRDGWGVPSRPGAGRLSGEGPDGDP